MREILIVCLAAALLTSIPAAPVWSQQNIVVVLDDSGSMDDSMRTEEGRVRRIDAAKRALSSVLVGLPADAKLGVVTLNTQVDGSHWIVPLGDANRSTWQSNIDRIRAKGGTPLGEFLKQGADALVQARSKQIYGVYRLLVVTDGEANDENLVERYLPQILARGVIVDVIGVDMQSDHSLATRVHNYRRADDDAALESAISEVFAETSASAQDADSDFEILAALPDEFAAEAVATLTSLSNEPLSDDWNIPISTPGSSNGTFGTAFGGALFCCGGMFILVGVVLVLSLLGKRSR